MPDDKNVKIAEKGFSLASKLIDKMITMIGDKSRRGVAC
jgi:hypothetical protein